MQLLTFSLVDRERRGPSTASAAAIPCFLGKGAPATRSVSAAIHAEIRVLCRRPSQGAQWSGRHYEVGQFPHNGLDRRFVFRGKLVEV